MLSEFSENSAELLLVRCGRGDRQALSSLYAAQASKLYGVAFSILGNTADASDALQEAFIKIWYTAERFHADRGTAAGWLMTIARNQSIDIQRSRKRRDGKIVRIEMEFLADDAPGPESSAISANKRGHLYSCLATLPSSRAAAVRGAYLSGLTYAELAKAFALPVNTMRTNLRRDLIALRKCLNLRFADIEMGRPQKTSPVRLVRDALPQQGLNPASSSSTRTGAGRG